MCVHETVYQSQSEQHLRVVLGPTTVRPESTFNNKQVGKTVRYIVNSSESNGKQEAIDASSGSYAALQLIDTSQGHGTCGVCVNITRRVSLPS